MREKEVAKLIIEVKNWKLILKEYFGKIQNFSKIWSYRQSSVYPKFWLILIIRLSQSGKEERKLRPPVKRTGFLEIKLGVDSGLCLHRFFCSLIQFCQPFQWDLACVVVRINTLPVTINILYSWSKFVIFFCLFEIVKNTKLMNEMFRSTFKCITNN